MSDIRIYRPPTGQDQRYPKVEKVKPDGHKKKRDEEEEKGKKKKNTKMDDILSSLAQNLSHEE